MNRRLISTLCAFAALSSAPAWAVPVYSDIYFFGSSTLDTGNFLNATPPNGQQFAPTASKGYYDGRWQEGYAWSDYLAQSLGFDATSSSEGGTNYAYGIAWAGPFAGETHSPLENALAFSNQIDAALTQPLKSDALYVVSIGQNDPNVPYNRTVAEAPQVAGLVIDQLERLQSAGASSFLVQLLGGGPNNLFSSAFNESLLSGLDGLIAGGATVSIVDTFAFTSSLTAQSLLDLGITDLNVTHNCLGNQACRAAAIASATANTPYLGNQFITFDGMHLNTKILQQLANYALDQLPASPVPEPDSLVLLIGGLLCMLVRRRTVTA
jgi:phospholipase/lecithinase/hemolysin